MKELDAVDGYIAVPGVTLVHAGFCAMDIKNGLFGTASTLRTISGSLGWCLSAACLFFAQNY